MNIAIIINNIVSNIAVFNSLATANGMYPDAICVNADENNCAIGDTYLNGEFIKAPEPIDVEAYLLDIDFRLMMVEEGVI